MADFDFVRGSEQGLDGSIIVQFEVTSDFTESDLDNQTICGVLESTGTTPQMGNGAEDDPVGGFLLSLAEGEDHGSFIVAGPTPECLYTADSGEDPDVGDAVTSAGNKRVKQAATLANTGAGARAVGRGHVYWKDTTATSVKLIL